MFLRKKKGYKTPVYTVPPATREHVPSKGPGTNLKRLFRTIGFKPCSGCIALADQMNTGGKEWCLEHFEYIVAQVCGRAERQGYQLETWRPWIERAVRIAIR